jgi:hypothetical protein
MRSWWLPRRATEATANQLVVTGAAGGYGQDPVDNDVGFRRSGTSRREMPEWTLEKARAFSVAAYRINPMARAIIDTYTSFCVGDSGVKMTATNPQVFEVANEFWTDPKVALADLQILMLRDLLVLGEQVHEMLVGPTTGVTRFSPVDPTRVSGVELIGGNPLWPGRLLMRQPGEEDVPLNVVQVDDITHLRTGEAYFWAPWRTLLTDRRSQPFLGPILDWLDNYDSVINNLIDRTALARYLVWDVEVQGTQKNIDEFIASRGGYHVPSSATIEVHNQGIKWQPQSVNVGAQEDSVTAQSVLTGVAGGAGLSKTWLAEPDHSNRATSLTMAEPVRRRVGGVQTMWLNYVRELVCFAVDQAVAAKRLPAMVEVPGSDGPKQVRASDCVQINGPSIAASDAQVNAQTLLFLSQAFGPMVAGGLLTSAAAKVALKKGWEDYTGTPYTPELDKPEDPAAVDKLAEHLEKNPPAAPVLHMVVGGDVPAHVPGYDPNGDPDGTDPH